MGSSSGLEEARPFNGAYEREYNPGTLVGY